jgi:hypothetical protein
VENSSQNQLRQVIPFLKEKYAPANTWDDKDILKYLEWAAGNDFLFVARNDDDSIAGAAVARPVETFPDTLFEFNRKGKNVHINFLVADNNKAFMLLGFVILEAFITCRTVTFNRLKDGLSKPKSYPATKVRKTLFNLRNHHG